jgi:hypothetical protein
MMIFYRKYLMILLLMLALLPSCNKSLDNISREVAGQEGYWTNFSETKASLFGIYGLMRSALVSNNGHWLYGEIREGDFSVYSRSDLNAVRSSTLNSSYRIIKELSDWRRFYAVINAATVFIENAPKVQQTDNRYSDTYLTYDIVQARILRAFAYFYMCRIWGDVPLITKSFDNGTFPLVGLNSQDEVLSYVENELKACLENVPYFYKSGGQDSYYGMSSWDYAKFAVNKITAYSLLAHVAAWKGVYSDVEVYTKFILDNFSSNGNIKSNDNIYDLVNSNNGMFSPGYNNPQILAFYADYNKGESSVTGHLEQLTLAKPVVNKEFPDIYVNKDTIQNIYIDSDDLRFSYDTIAISYRDPYITNFTSTYPIFRKIQVIRSGNASNNNFATFSSNLIFTRIEEIKLLRAEALAVLGRRIEALDMLNQIRKVRINRLSNYEFNLNSPIPLLDEIFNERRRELIGEGWRFYDLVRFHRITAKDTRFNDLIKNKGIYWPISEEVLNRNSLLIDQQNPFWK